MATGQRESNLWIEIFNVSLKKWCPILPIRKGWINTHTHTHTHTLYIYIYIYMLERKTYAYVYDIMRTVSTKKFRVKTFLSIYIYTWVGCKVHMMTTYFPLMTCFAQLNPSISMEEKMCRPQDNQCFKITKSGHISRESGSANELFSRP